MRNDLTKIRAAILEGTWVSPDTKRGRNARDATTLRTAENVACSLSTGLNMAHDKHGLERVPAFPKGWMRRTTARTTTTTTYTAAELDQIIDACEERYRQALLLGSYAPERSQALRRDDIGLGGASVRVDEATKTAPGGGVLLGAPSPMPTTALYR